MKHNVTFAAALLLAACNSGEEIVATRTSEPVARVIEYVPAPGQFINEPKSGFADVTTPEEARAYAERRLQAGNYLSLGGWGGYVVAAFGRSVPQSDDYELWVRGNTYGENTSEPGAVWVAQDTDGDGSPDGEVWYELHGSRYYDPATIHDYRIVYTRAADGEPTPWADNRDNTGEIGRMDDFHTQPNYYPAWIGEDELVFEGVRLPSNLSESQIGGQLVWVLTSFEWGYADNVSAVAVGQVNRFRIAHAVTADGMAVQLPYVDFIKVQTGVNGWNPLTGEVSTEVCGIGCYRTATSAE